MKKQIGKNTLGSGNKMTVDLRTYNRSTHDLSRAWRSTMSCGTLVPCMSEVALPGDTWELGFISDVQTHPTTGPLYGSYKLQIDVFTCPMRLYNAMLHNNMIGVGLNMSQVKLPKLKVTITKNDNPTEDNEFSQINPSCLLAYLGKRGWGVESRSLSKQIKKQCVPELSYYDIFKNFYANKQEDQFYTIGVNDTVPYTVVGNNIVYEEILIGKEAGDRNVRRWATVIKKGSTYEIKSTNNISRLKNLRFSKRIITYEDREKYDIQITLGNSNGTFTNKITFQSDFELLQDEVFERFVQADDELLYLKAWDLKSIDEIREMILSKGSAEVIFGDEVEENVISQFAKRSQAGSGTDKPLKSSYSQFGLALKTHQSDIFNNWINTEWIDGDNGIAAITAVDVSDGKLLLDQLNLQQKVYELLNRVAVSGGTYKDWVETVYTTDFHLQVETPVYEGGLSAEVEFQSVISQNTGTSEPLGTLAGRGRDGKHKGGKVRIKVSEPSYIMAIVSLTPRVDYSQGNHWDMHLDTLDDLHKPALDGIGYQDLMANRMAWWKPENISIGKQPAWIEYMTSVNEVYGNFALRNNEAYMCLNRIYKPENGDYINGKLNYSTYIDPTDYNYIFAQTSLDAQNFWVQIGIGAKVRRVMSAKQIPII